MKPTPEQEKQWSEEFQELKALVQISDAPLFGSRIYFEGCKKRQEELEKETSRANNYADMLRDNRTELAHLNLAVGDQKIEIEALKSQLNISTMFHCPHFLTDGGGHISCQSDYKKLICELLGLLENVDCIDSKSSEVINKWFEANLSKIKTTKGVV